MTSFVHGTSKDGKDVKVEVSRESVRKLLDDYVVMNITEDTRNDLIARIRKLLKSRSDSTTW